MMKAFLTWIDDKLEITLLSAGLCMIALLMMIQVVCRYFLNHALSWPEELSCYIHIWYTFLGISYATKRGLHLRVDAFLKAMPQFVQRILNMLANLALLLFYLYMVVTGIGVEQSLIQTNQLSPAMRLPMWLVYLSLLVGCALAILRLGQVSIQSMGTKRKEA